MSDLDDTTGPTRDTGTTENVVERLVARCIEEGAESPSAVADLCRGHSELTAEVLACLAELDAAGMSTRPRLDDEFPERLGDFRLIDRIGGGGMGVVYRARQESLQREVALKLIRPEQLYFPGARKRFQREVETVARMQHPGIVPIFAVGEEDGIPYFAMEHVGGCSMDRILTLLRGRPFETLSGVSLHETVCELAGEPVGDVDPLFDGTWTEACFRIGAAIAAALAHAHERGVLHRDVKPSNVMLTPAGRVMLLDFGVSSAEGSSKLTSTGAQVGSLPYMSPQQAAGRHDEVDVQADVYSLGVTLYEMLTLRLPYRGRDAAETRALIDEGVPVPPRRLNPHISWDAETVCLTAMRRERSQRYRDVDELRRDLLNVLEKRVITARRPGPLLRARRWVQRNPTTTVALGLGFLLVVGGPLAFGLREMQVAERLREANERTTRALAREEAARTRAEENLRKACRAVDTLLTRIAEDKLRRIPGVQKLRTTVLADAVSFYDELLAENPGNPIVLTGAAFSLNNIGDMRQVLGQFEQALDDYARARDLWLQIEGPDTGNPTILTGLAKVEHNAAYLLDNLLRRHDEAEQRYLRALDWLGRGEVPDDFRRQAEIATVYTNLGSMLTRSGRFDDAGDALGEAVSRFQALYDERPDDGAAVQIFVNALDLSGSLAMERGDPARAEAFWLRARVKAEELLELDPENPGPRQALVTAVHNLAYVAGRTSRFDEALELYREALGQARALARDFPAILPFQQTLCQTLNSLSQAVTDARQRRALLEESIEVYERLVPANPDVLDLRLELTQALQNLALLLASTEPGTAEALMKKALALLDEVPEDDPARDALGYTVRGAALRNSFGAVLMNARRWEEAHALLATGTAMWESLIESGRASMMHRSALGGAYSNLAMCHRYQGEFTTARTFALKALETQQVAYEANPRSPHVLRFLRSHLRELRIAEIELGDFDAGLAAGARIVELFPEPAEMVLQAQVHCDAATREEPTPGLSAAEQAAKRRARIDAAIDLLERAVDAGYRDAKLLEESLQFEILADEERFLDLLDDLELDD